MTNTTIEQAVRTKSLAMQDRGRAIIPGMTQLLSKRPDQFAPSVWPGYFSRAKGVEVWDLDGNKYYDMSIGGIGANILGYADSDIDDAVMQAISHGGSCSLNCPEEVELAELLCELHPWAEKVRLARTGGEAMAMAVRIARASTGRDKIAFCGYHGWHDWYLAANIGTEDALGNHLLTGLKPAGVPRVLEGTALPFRYNRIDELEDIIDVYGSDIAAVVMEPIRSEQPNEGFLQDVRLLAEKAGAVLIFDEISSGFRLNTGGAHMILDVTPDVAVFSKALGNGYAIAAIIGRSAVMEAAQTTFISSTNWTERIGPVAAIAVLEKHRRHDVGKHLISIGEAIQSGWKTAAEKHGLPIHISGIAPMSHFSLETSEPMAAKALFVQLMLQRGFLASTAFYAMYAHNLDHVGDYFEAVDTVFGEIADLNRTGDIMTELIGQPATAGFTRLA